MRKRFPFPSEVGNIDADWKRFLKLQFDDIYPQIQPFTPTLVNVSNPDNYTVTTDLIRQARLWSVNIDIVGSSTSTNGYMELPFTSFATSLFLVKMDTDTTPKVAYIEKNTTRLILPDWTSATRVIISGTAGE